MPSCSPVLAYNALLGGVFWALLTPFRILFRMSQVPEPTKEVEHALEILHDAEARDEADQKAK